MMKRGSPGAPQPAPPRAEAPAWAAGLEKVARHGLTPLSVLGNLAVRGVGKMLPGRAQDQRTGKGWTENVVVREPQKQPQAPGSKDAAPQTPPAQQQWPQAGTAPQQPHGYPGYATAPPDAGDEGGYGVQGHGAGQPSRRRQKGPYHLRTPRARTPFGVDYSPHFTGLKGWGRPKPQSKFDYMPPGDGLWEKADALDAARVLNPGNKDLEKMALMYRSYADVASKIMKENVDDSRVGITERGEKGTVRYKDGSFITGPDKQGTQHVVSKYGTGSATQYKQQPGGPPRPAGKFTDPKTGHKGALAGLYGVRPGAAAQPPAAGAPKPPDVQSPKRGGALDNEMLV